jgi:histidyl-tRNA synthetase
MAKPSLPQGTRDFGPDVVRKRNYILDTIRNVFELYGFQPLETPAMENLDTLMGKYGEEGDKLIFKILNNGLDNPAKEKQAREDFEKILQGRNNIGITERALKYDLTIPFARYVAMNHGQLSFPFKRYQVQPVWRADRPQRGRYREFYQCDADVVGSNALLNEVELAGIYHDVFSRLGLGRYELKINHRKILAALSETCGGRDKMTDITIAIDKLDKIGLEKVKEELTQRGLTAGQCGIIEKYLSISGNNEEVVSGLNTLIGHTETGKKGIEEISYVLDNLASQNIKIQPDPTLARGLNYYTGIIFEVKAPAEVKMGSIGGGGRYDDLTGLFGVPDIPGVGISFGVDRIYDVMEELNLFPANVYIGTQVLFFNLGEAESKAAFGWLQLLRHKGVRAELFHETAKFDKQFKYAEKKNIPFIIIIGDKELKEKTCTIKNLATGQQETIDTDKLIAYKF